MLAQDPVGQGERYSYYEPLIETTTVCQNVTEHDYAGSQCFPLGDSIARYFLHDSIRSLDYLCSRPEVDPDKIGITGCSGGGTQSMLLMLSGDKRVSCAAPATFVMNRELNMYTGMAQDSEQIWQGLTALGLDHEDAMIMMVPRPTLVLAAKYDYFPIEGTRSTVNRTRRFWELYGKTDNLELFEDDTPHTYTVGMAKKVSEFFALHLLGTEITASYDDIKPLRPEELNCTKTGQVRGDIPDSDFVFEENLKRLSEVEAQRYNLSEDEYKKRAMNWLYKTVYYNRIPCDSNPRHFETYIFNDLLIKNSMWWTHEGIANYAVTFRDFKYKDEKLPVTIALWEGGTTKLSDNLKWIRKICASKRAVMVLDIVANGKTIPVNVMWPDQLDFYGTLFKLNHDLIWLGDSLAAMRVYDVVRAVDIINEINDLSNDDTQIFALGSYCVYAGLASALNNKIKNVESWGWYESYKEWIGSRYYDHYNIMSIVLPGMLQYFDLPDLEKFKELGID